jgi:tRNA-dihydrouridine synthase A
MKDVFAAMMPYIEDELAQGTRLHSITRHFVGAFHGVPGARAFRRHLAQNGVKSGAGVNVLRDAIALVEDRAIAPPGLLTRACPISGNATPIHSSMG